MSEHEQKYEGMPACLLAFLNGLNREDADKVWAWFDENPFATQEVIEVLADRFPITLTNHNVDTFKKNLDRFIITLDAKFDEKNKLPNNKN